MYVKHVHEIKANKVEAGRDTSMQMLISSEEAPHFAMRKFTIQPGGSMPNHTNLVEHEQYVLEGKAKVGIGDEIFEVQSGDVVLIPAGIAHWYENIGEEPLEFLCLVPNEPDHIEVLK